jgi:O-antigen ligase
MPALILTLISLIILPQTKLEWESGVFLLCAGIAILFAAGSRIRQTTSKPGLAILAFWIVCVAHVGFVFTESITTTEYIRGLVPFVFLVFFFVVLRLTSLRNFQTLYHGIIAVGLLYAMENIILLPKVLTGEVWRTTFQNTNHNIPLPVVGFHLSIALVAGKQARIRVKLLLLAAAALMLLSSFLTGTRSLIIASLVPLVVLPFAEARASLSKWARYAIAVGLLGLIFVFVPTEIFLKGARIGASQAGSIDTRMQENQVSWKFFTDSPIIGNGLGFRFDTTGLYYQATRVGYVHNSYLYLLMDFGIFGLLYILPPLLAMRSLRGVRAGPHRDVATGLAMAVFGLLTLSFGFAMVRLMHFNVIFAVLIGMLEVLKREYGFSAAWQAARYRVFAVTRVQPGMRPVLESIRRTGT